jgi:hypothetical protein
MSRKHADELTNAPQGSQVFNPATGHYLLRDGETGLFLEASETPFEGVAVEENTIGANPSVKKDTALRAERAVLALAQAALTRAVRAKTAR